MVFRFKISDIEGKFKLSQNKTPDNVAGVMVGLSQVENPQASIMADYFEKKL